MLSGHITRASLSCCPTTEYAILRSTESTVFIFVYLQNYHQYNLSAYSMFLLKHTHYILSKGKAFNKLLSKSVS